MKYKKPQPKQQYMFGSLINSGVTSLAKGLGANDKTAEIIGSGVATATGFIPGMQANLTQAGDLIGDVGTAAGDESGITQSVGQMANLAGQALPMFMAQGGQIPGGLVQFQNGGTHEQNPNGGIPVGPNALVEEGETMDGRFVFSDRLKVNKTLAKEFNLPKKAIGKSFAEVSKMFEDSSRPNDAIAKRGYEKEIANLKQAQEAYKAASQPQQPQMMAYGGKVKYDKGGDVGNLNNEYQLSFGQLPSGITEPSYQYPVNQNQEFNPALGSQDRSLNIEGNIYNGGNPTPQQPTQPAQINRGYNWWENRGRGRGFTQLIRDGFSNESTPVQSQAPSQPFMSDDGNRPQGSMPFQSFNAGANATPNNSWFYTDNSNLPQTTPQQNTTQTQPTASNNVAAQPTSRETYTPITYGLPNSVGTPGLPNFNLRLEGVGKTDPLASRDAYNTNIRNEDVAEAQKELAKGNNNLSQYATMARFAPVAASIANLAMLEEPQAKNINMFDTNQQFNPNLIDAEQLARDAESSGEATRNIIRNTRGNQGAAMANLVGSQLQTDKAVAGAHMQADSINQQELARVQGLNYQQDARNQAMRMQVQQINDMDRGAYQGALMDSVASVGQNIGGVGSEFLNMEMVKNLPIGYYSNLMGGVKYDS